ncbi:hypothetical protein NSQ26_06065 [Bacillus sp. FSL W7-1360]
MYVNKKMVESDPSFVSSHHHINRTRTATKEMAVQEDGHYIVKSGTVYPANDASAEGIVYHSVDVTSGNQPVSVMVEGYVYEERLPQQVTPEAKEAMKQIKFESYNKGGM